MTAPTLTVTPDRCELGKVITVGWDGQGSEGHLKMVTGAFDQWYAASYSGSLSIPATVPGTVTFELKGPARRALRAPVKKSVTVGDPAEVTADVRTKQ